jgi:hypothetical protein
VVEMATPAGVVPSATQAARCGSRRCCRAAFSAIPLERPLHSLDDTLALDTCDAPASSRTLLARSPALGRVKCRVKGLMWPALRASGEARPDALLVRRYRVPLKQFTRFAENREVFVCVCVRCTSVPTVQELGGTETVRLYTVWVVLD